MGQRIGISATILGIWLVLSGCGGTDAPDGGGGSGGGSEPAARAAETACDDGADNDGDGHADCADLDCRAAGEVCALVPPVDRTVATTVGESAQFLYLGVDPIQKEADPAAFDARRVAIVRGKVVDAGGAALAGVRIRVKGHDEYGYTETRPDGLFDMAVNGGDRLVFEYARDGFVSAERVMHPAWQRYETLPEVGLIEPTQRATTVRAGAAAAQVAASDRVEDEHGSREAVVVFKPGTRATAELPDGTSQELASLGVRVTQYPVDLPAATGEGWSAAPRFAPGTLPRAGVQLGLELSVDDATALGASSVRFSEPVAVYIDNFLGLPAGAPVPLGFYNPERSEWEAASAGRVLEVLSVAGGTASLDADGDGAPEDSDTLAELGIDAAELGEVSKRFEAGDRVWRAEVSHFSTWVFSGMTITAPPTATAPNAGSVIARPLDVPSRRGAAVIETQALAQTIAIAGTPYSLHYQSDRTTAYGPGFQLEVPVTTDDIPEGLVGVLSQVEIAGQRFTQFFDARPNQKHVVVWDGRNSLGQLVQGPQVARVLIGNAFAGLVRAGGEFGIADIPLTEDGEVSIPTPVAFVFQELETRVGVWDAKGYDLGGVSLDALHAYDPVSQTVFFGWGDQKSADNVALVVRRPVEDFDLGAPDAVVVAGDGSVVVTDDQRGRILRARPDGSVEVIAGEGAPGEAGALRLGSPQGVAIAGDGSIVFADYYRNAIRSVSPTGGVTTLVGEASDDPLVEAVVDDLEGIAIGVRGELYLTQGAEVWRLEGGELTTVAGGGTAGDGPATEALLLVPSGLVAAPDGSIFVSEREGHRVRKITPDGIIRTVAGTGEPGFAGDGGAAVDAQLNEPRGLAIAADGSLYIADQLNDRIRRVTPDGLIQTVVGGGDATLEDG